MLPPESLLILSAASLAGLAMLGGFTAWGWRGWLQLRHHALDHDRPAELTGVTARIEVADLKERIRKLEAIAAGVDL